MYGRICVCIVAALVCAGAATALAGPHEAPATLDGLRLTSARDGTVTLSGQANSRAAAQRAVEIARGSDGVKRVDSRLTVVRQTRH
jgi:hypothetical protein